MATLRHHRVIAAVIVQLVKLNDVKASNDPILDVWAYQICVQCVQALGMITACVPYLKPFLESLQAGALRTDDATIRLFGTAATSKQKSQATHREYVELGRESGAKRYWGSEGVPRVVDRGMNSGSSLPHQESIM